MMNACATHRAWPEITSLRSRPHAHRFACVSDLINTSLQGKIHQRTSRNYAVTDGAKTPKSSQRREISIERGTFRSERLPVHSEINAEVIKGQKISPGAHASAARAHVSAWKTDDEAGNW